MKEAINVLGGKARGATASVLHSLHVVAAVISGKTGVPILVGGTEASNDGHRIRIPAIDLLSPSWRALTYGYLIHESFHGRYTDFAVYGEASTQPLRKQLLNAVEDPVIERRGIEEFPGVRQDINEVVREMIRTGGFGCPGPDDHPGAVLSGYVLYKLRHDLTGQSQLRDLLNVTETRMRELFPASAMLRLNILLKDAAECFTSADCLDLADSIIVMLKEEEEKERNPPPPEPRQPDQDGGEGQGHRQGQDVQAEGGSHGQSDGHDEGGGQEQGAAQSGTASGQDGNGQSGKSDHSATGSGQNDAAQDQGKRLGGERGRTQRTNPADHASTCASASGLSSSQSAGAGSGGDGKCDRAKADAIAQALSASASDLPADTFGDLGKRLSAVARSENPDVVPIPALPGVWPAPENQTFGQQRLEKVRATSSRIRSQMQGLIQASRQTPARRARAGRTIDGSRLALVPTGEDRIFLRRDDVRAPNTAFHLLVDKSGSMDRHVTGGQQIDVACEACLALALALEGVPGVSVAASAFPGVLSMLRRGESVKAAAGRFTLSANGGTPMAPAMWHAVTEIARAPEERKVIMVLTDGSPDQPLPVEHVVKRCMASGVEVIGIGIGTAVVQTLFPVSAVISDVKQLRDVMFNLARRALLAKAA